MRSSHVERGPAYEREVCHGSDVINRYRVTDRYDFSKYV